MGIFLLDDIKFYYRCDEASGTREDASSNGLDVNEIGTVPTAAGARSLAVDGTGNSSNRLEASHNDGFRGSGANGITVSAWVKIATGAETANQPIVAHWANASRGWLLWHRPIGANQFLRFNVSSDGAATDGEVAWTVNTPLDAFVHVVAWYDPVNDVLGMRVNGAAAVTAAHTAGIFANTAPLGIAQANLSSIVVATELVDEIGAWDRVLNDDEQDFLFSSGTPPDFATFVATPTPAPDSIIKDDFDAILADLFHSESIGYAPNGGGSTTITAVVKEGELGGGDNLGEVVDFVGIEALIIQVSKTDVPVIRLRKDIVTYNGVNYQVKGKLREDPGAYLLYCVK